MKGGEVEGGVSVGRVVRRLMEGLRPLHLQSEIMKERTMHQISESERVGGGEREVEELHH
jgi:hypothetical protein